MKGLLALLGKPESEDSEASPESKGGAERSLAKEAFSALRDDDEEGFVEAFIGAVEACVAKKKSGGYDADDEE